MATTICYRRATRTSTSVRTTFGVGATVQNAVYTIPARTVLVPYTTSTCVTRLATRACGSYVTSRYSISPAHLSTTSVTLHVQRTSYITNYVTLYSTSCTVSRPTTPTPPPKPVTTYVTIGTTTTRTSIIHPSQTTVGPSSESGIIDLPPTDTPVTADGPVTAGHKKVPVGAIVGGVLGGLVAAALIGFLVFMLLFKKSKRYSQDSGREYLDQRPLSTADGHSSPSEGSSAGVLHPQMQEYGPRYSNIYTDQGHQYAHVRQDSQTIAMPVPVAGIGQVSPVSSPGPGEQGNHYPRGQYVGHAEIQDSRF